MDFKLLKWQLLSGPLMRRVILRAFMLVLALIILSLMQSAREIWAVEPIVIDNDECPLSVGLDQDLDLTALMDSLHRFSPPPTPCNLTKASLKEVIGMNLLHSNARALCVGEGSSSAVKALRHLGLSDAVGVRNHPSFSLLKRRLVYKLDFEDDHFDFVFCRDIDRVSVPALVGMEIERVLRPGGIAAMLIGLQEPYSIPLLCSFFKSSKSVYLIGTQSFWLVIFKKKSEAFASFEHFQLPSNCPALEQNKPFLELIEPLADKRSSELSYLPNFVHISSRNRVVYINIGAGEFVQSNVAEFSKVYLSDKRMALEVFVVDHKTSVLSSYVTNPGINFVYLPGLAGDVATAPPISADEHLSAPVHEEGFDFVSWFNETVSDGDFVILMMNAKLVELNILAELFKTGGICRVDELFLKCPDAVYCKTTVCGDCVNTLKSLRKSGVYVHQWSGD